MDILSIRRRNKSNPFRDVLGPLLHRQFGTMQVFGDFPFPGFGFAPLKLDTINDLQTEAFARLDPVQTSDEDSVLATFFVDFDADGRWLAQPKILDAGHQFMD